MQPGGNTYSCSVTAPWTGTITLAVIVNGNPKCGGNPDPDEVVYSGSSINVDITYNFPVLECD